MLIWHAGLGMLISLPKKVCKGNYLPAEEWAYSKTRRYRRLIMLSKQNWRLKNADCHQLQYFLYKTGCAALEVNKQQFSISIVVPLPSPFSRKVPFAPPQKKKHHQFGLLNNMLIVDLDQCDQKIYLPEKKMMWMTAFQMTSQHVW